MKLKRLPRVNWSKHPDERVRGWVNGILWLVRQMQVAVLDKRSRDYRVRIGR